MIQPSRIKALNRRPVVGGRYVLYWMQASPRTRDNHALEYALRQANDRRLPLVVCFVIDDGYPGATPRSMRFMVQGLIDALHFLADLGVRLVVRRGNPPTTVLRLAQEAALVVVDQGYLRGPRAWYARLAEQASCLVMQAETNVVVPVAAASSKAEYAAWTLRRKIEPLLDAYLLPLEASSARTSSLGMDIWGDGVAALCLDYAQNVDDSLVPCGGQQRALTQLDAFLESGLDSYAARRNDPCQQGTSRLSSYLHFGQLSPLTVALAARSRGGEGVAPLLEQLIVRRELAINYVYYQAHYDGFAGLPPWCQRTLLEHEADPRPALYDLDQLAQAGTHDKYWNAAQRQMTATGWMHGYMRMYWGKKVIEWSETPQAAFERLLFLNDRYELDGRDPNGYAGIAWCFGLHDRPWKTRPVFGSVRYMNARGLLRKFDAEEYVRQVEKTTGAPIVGIGL